MANQENWDSAEAREVETLDVFFDEQVWIESQRMVEELWQGMPEKARDTFVWDKDAAREVFYARSYKSPQITADTTCYIEIQSR